MERLLSLAAACLISCALAFGQGTTPAQSPTPSASQENTGPAAASNGATPGSRAAHSPSRANQALPDNANPSRSPSDATANGQAVQPNGASSGTAGTASGNTPNSGNNGMAKDDTGNNPASGRGSNTITNPGTGGTVQWFWVALGIIIALIAISAVLSRNRSNATIDRADPALRATRDGNDGDRRDDQIRKVG
ncbi:MAG: hypothetical protein JOZ10_11470 [Acidobacteria bacterium]|nr:hypothetical protein [Acidobacteriota bacterium]MBV9146420.1 hypothetical protein [Acidobacteriota bacterium]MBV9436342.1 hypothetical protein [Acidobacteriota bacterium]